MADTSQEGRVAEALKFFQNLYGDKTIQLPQAELRNRNKPNQSFHEGQTRFLVKPGSMKMRFWLDNQINKSDQGREIFYSPTPMSGASGRKKTQAKDNSVIHGDADHGLSREVHALLVNLGACLVLSGGKTEDGRPKYHVYLLLDREISPNEVERLNRGLRHLIDGDKFDVTSLLRIPGTRNHKYPGKPLVRVERYATTKHSPTELAKHLPVPEGEVVVSGVELAGMKMPKVPEGFNYRSQKPGYAKMRDTVRQWNGRFEEGHGRRYMAALALVKDGLKRNLSVDEVYAFALECAPLVDKQEEENGYTIQKDIARTYYRETKTAPTPSGLTVEKIQREVADRPAPRELPADEIGEVIPPAMFRTEGDGPSPYSSRGNSRQYVDMAIFTSGNFKPPEPEFFAVADFHLLYRSLTHCIFGDSGSGKTWIVLAQIAKELKAGRRVKYIDFENGAMTIGHRLRNVLGVPAGLLTPEHFRYMYFSEMPDEVEIRDEADEAHDLVVIDGVDASLALFQKAMNSATEVREWYDSFPQKFANAGSTVVVIDHTSKGNRDKVDPRHQEPGGTPAKLAVLTGAAYFVKPEENRELVPGERGVVQAYITRKDKDGFLKSRARKDGHLFNFIIDTVGGQTVVEFESAKELSGPAPRSTPTLTDEEREILTALSQSSAPMNVTRIKAAMPKAGKTVGDAITRLVNKDYIHQETGSGRSKLNSITTEGLAALRGESAPAPDGQLELDFSRVKDRPNAGPKRECRRCGELEHLVRPDEIGYQPGRPLCRPCASESIESETHIPRDGAEWARKKREAIERRSRTHEDE